MRNARAFVVAVAIAAALLSTYPLLFGRSVVSPLLGGVALLYRDPPYTPGTAATDLENPRAIDMLTMLAQEVPYTAVQRSAVLAGEWPLWNRYVGLGRPLHGQGQPTLLDPLHVISLIPRNPAAGIDLRVVAARIVFTIGMALLALETAGLRAGMTLAITAPFIGLFLERLAHPAQFSIVYLPWLLLGYAITARDAAKPTVRTGAAMLVWAGTALVLVASPAKEAAVNLLVAHFTGVMMVALARGTTPWRSFRILAIGLVCVGGITAPHWLVFADTWARAETAYDAERIIVAGWRDLVALIAGPVMPGTPGPSLNALLITLAVVAVLPGATRLAPPARAAAIATAVTLGLGYGVVPERWLVSVPLVGNLQRIGSLAILAALVPLLLLAAHGVARLREPRVPAWAALIVCATYVAAVWPLAAQMTIAPRFAIMAATSVVIGALLPVLTSLRVHRLQQLGVALGAVVILLPGGLHAKTGVDAIDRLLMQPPPRPDYTLPSPHLVQQQAQWEQPGRVVGLDGMLRGGTQAIYRLEGVMGHDALLLPTFERLMPATGIPWDENQWERQLRTQDLARLDPVLDMFGVKLLLLPPEATMGELVPGEPMRSVSRPGAWPRAFFTSAVRTHADTSVFIENLAATNRPFASISMSDADAMQIAGHLATSGGASHVAATSYHLSPNRTSFRVNASGSGVVVLMESWVAHDFESRLNGQVVPYFRVNEVGKAVVIPSAGDWEVTFEYRPRLWAMAWWMTLAGAIGLAVLVGTQIRRASRAGQ